MLTQIAVLRSSNTGIWEEKKILPSSKDMGSADESQTSSQGLWQCVIVFQCKTDLAAVAELLKRAFEEGNEISLVGGWASSKSQIFEMIKDLWNLIHWTIHQGNKIDVFLGN